MFNNVKQWYTYAEARVKENTLRHSIHALESGQIMPAKDERIGFRLASDTKDALLQIAKKEGRSLAQICELLLKGGIWGYEKEGSKYLQRFLLHQKERDK